MEPMRLNLPTDGQLSSRPSNCSGRNRSVHQEAFRSGPVSGGRGEMKMVFVPSVSTWVRTLAFSPVRAAMTAVTEATPITMPMVVSTERVLCAQICPTAR